ARSNMLLLPRLGGHVILCGPPQLLPDSAANAGPGISVERDFEAALRKSQVVMMLRIQAERLAGMQLGLAQYQTPHRLTAPRPAPHPPAAGGTHRAPTPRPLERPAGPARAPQPPPPDEPPDGVARRCAVVKPPLTAHKESRPPAPPGAPPDPPATPP